MLFAQIKTDRIEQNRKEESNRPSDLKQKQEHFSDGLEKQILQEL